MQQDNIINERVTSLAAIACAELFDAYGLTLTRTTHSWGETDDRLLCGVVGFVGRRFRGSCLVAGCEAPLVASCPSGNQLRDWVGELANQLAGRVKAKLINLGVEVSLTTPIVISGVRLEPLPRSDIAPTVFTSAEGDVMVWAEAEAASGFVFGSERPAASNGEGDVLLF
jgi:hypothetical protein